MGACETPSKSCYGCARFCSGIESVEDAVMLALKGYMAKKAKVESEVESSEAKAG